MPKKSKPAPEKQLVGFSITTSTGSQVWLGKTEQGFLIKLKNMNGNAEVLTTLHVSDGAMNALAVLYSQIRAQESAKKN